MYTISYLKRAEIEFDYQTTVKNSSFSCLFVWNQLQFIFSRFSCGDKDFGTHTPGFLVASDFPTMESDANHTGVLNNKVILLIIYKDDLNVGCPPVNQIFKEDTKGITPKIAGFSSRKNAIKKEK